VSEEKNGYTLVTNPTFGWRLENGSLVLIEKTDAEHEHQQLKYKSRVAALADFKNVKRNYISGLTTHIKDHQDEIRNLEDTIASLKVQLPPTPLELVGRS